MGGCFRFLRFAGMNMIVHVFYMICSICSIYHITPYYIRSIYYAHHDDFILTDRFAESRAISALRGGYFLALFSSGGSHRLLRSP